MRRSAGCRPQPQHVVLYKQVLTVNFNSVLRSDVINGILMQTNATWDQVSLCLMQCFVVIVLCTERWIVLHWYHIHMCCDRCSDKWSNDRGWLEHTGSVWVYSPNNDRQCLFTVQIICISPKCYLLFNPYMCNGNVCGIEYAKKNIKISLDDHYFHSLLFLLN